MRCGTSSGQKTTGTTLQLINNELWDRDPVHSMEESYWKLVIALLASGSYFLSSPVVFQIRNRGKTIATIRRSAWL
jgi:hypothetical protein